MLSFDENELFNSKRLQEYDADGQKGFLGYLLRYKEWKISENKIIFPNVKTKEQIEELLKEYDIETRKYYLIISKSTLENVNLFGMEKCKQLVEKERKEIEETENKKQKDRKKCDKIL